MLADELPDIPFAAPGHFGRARVAEQFDAVIHFDETRAVEPLERASDWDAGTEYEAFPTGL